MSNSNYDNNHYGGQGGYQRPSSGGYQRPASGAQGGYRASGAQGGYQRPSSGAQGGYQRAPSGGRQAPPARRKSHIRVTGRFYAFLTMLLVVCVFVGVLVNRGRSQQTTGGTFVPATRIAAENAIASASASANQPAQVAAAETPAPAQVTADNTAAADTSGIAAADAAALSGSGAASIDDLIENDPDLEPLSGADKVQVDNYSVTEGLPSQWRNILLLGSDTRNLKKVSRTDTMIIASINTNDGRIKLTSIMRDTMAPVPGSKGGMAKLNSASHYGGVDLTIKLVNELFGMNITEYVLVNFASFQKVVDILGGVEVDVTKEEMEYVNKGIGEMAEVAGYDKDWYVANKDSLLLKSYGTATHLTGIQALGYARIRKIGSDFQRTERQRKMLDAILQKVKNDANAIQFMQLASSMWGYFETNINMMSAVGLATTVIKNGVGEMEEWRLPAKDAFKSETRNGTSALYDVDFAACKEKLYKFIYES